VIFSDNDVPEGTSSEEKSVMSPGSLSERTGILLKYSVRPRQQNPSRDVLDSQIREKIIKIVNEKVRE
jgi:hypothetical protein